MSTGRPRSPYELALGDELGLLHPRLRAYFGPIPAGSAGIGHGVFEVVGAPHRWLRPMFALFAPDGIAFPVRAADVPFTVVNRPASEDGHSAVAARRTFRFDSGDRVMVDCISVVPGQQGSFVLIDSLGRSGRLRAAFGATVTDGSLQLRSHTVTVRFGRRWLRIPGFAAPVVTLLERWDQVAGVQRVRVDVRLPLLDTVYEYAGRFDYAVRPEEET